MPSLNVGRDGAGLRLDRFLRKALPNMPLSHIYKLLRKRKVRVNGKRARPEQILSASDTVLLHMAEQQFKDDSRRRKPRTTRLDFKVVFEDEDLLVVSKPPFLPAHPGAGHEGNSLIDQVLSYLDVGDQAAAHRPALAHRLDRDTSGLTLVGKSAPVLRRLNRLFHDGQVDKRYLALARGVPKPEEGLWEMEVERRDIPGTPGHPLRGRPDKAGRTAYRVALRRKLPWGAEVSLLVLRLLTGRTHQIRSHLYQIGCPLLGDPRYGDPELNRRLQEAFGLRRQFLHAFAVELVHPNTGATVRWVDQYPADLLPLVEALRLGIPEF